MSHRFWVSSGSSAGVLAIAMAGLLFAPAIVAGQASPAAAKPAAKTNAKKADAKPWTLPRTPDGQPDLQGYWTSLSFTPMERPAKYGGREFLTDEEMNEVFKSGVQHTYEFTFANTAETPVYDATTWALGAWQNGVLPNRRSSLVVDPPDGKIPALTPEAQKARAARAAGRRGGGEVEGEAVLADNPSDLGLGVRCINFGGPPILPGAYDSNVHIVQSPTAVIIQQEFGGEQRIVYMDGSPHLPATMHEWHGDARGHWEGDTLVVETTNFHPGATFQGANAKTVKITEYFTRTGPTTIEYKFTVDDPSTWVKPWSAIVPLNHVDGPLFEYACSEGNNGMVNTLAGARADEKAAGETKTTPKKD